MEKNFLSVGVKDCIKGAIMALITTLATTLYNCINTGSVPSDWVFWKTQLMIGVGAGISYIIKNWLTNSNGQFAKAEPKADETTPIA